MGYLCYERVSCLFRLSLRLYFIFETRYTLPMTDAEMQLSEPMFTLTDGAHIYRELRIEVISSHLLTRSYWYYFKFTVSVVCSFVFCALVLHFSTNPFVYTIAALGVGYFTVQIGGLLHEAAHRAIFTTSRNNDFLGYFLSFFSALSYQGWRDVHNRHHAHTNEEGEDPDMDLPLHAFTRNEVLQQTGISGLLIKYQSYLFHFVRLFATLTLRTTALKYEIRHVTFKTFPRLLLLIVSLYIWFVFPFIAYPIFKALLVLLGAHVVVGFYTSNIFAPNHKGMPHLKPGLKMSFVEQQIRTSRNISGNWLIDYVFMGLNYQIEHHLFPNCPRNKLRALQPVVQRFCRKYNL